MSQDHVMWLAGGPGPVLVDGTARRWYVNTDDYLTCDCCDIAWTKCRLQFYRCQKCSMELCAECEERRVNFK